MYPEINITLLYRKDYLRLLAKYGYGDMALAEVRGVDHTLFTEQQVQARVRELGAEITTAYKDLPLVLVGVLRGVVPFLADLVRAIDLPLDYDVLAISRYGNGPSLNVEVTKDLDLDVKGKQVLLVEDIVDTGLTLRHLLNHLASKGAAGVEVCSLLDKSVRRIGDLVIKYRGFEIPDEFVVGYGLDYQGRYRNLPYIGILKPVEPKAGIPLAMNISDDDENGNEDSEGLEPAEAAPSPRPRRRRR
jgi:hypoxanthine phosphoribosyltransferase